MISTRLLGLLSICVAFQRVTSQASLYIPSFDPQPVSAEAIGVDASGHTTWLIAPGQPSGSLTDEADFIGTATMVAGPNDAEIVLSNDFEYVSESCTISNSLANCVVVATAQGIISTTTLQETASPFPVQVGSSASQPTAGSGPSSPASSPTSSPSDSSQSGNIPSSTSGGSTPTNTSQPSGATRVFSTPLLLVEGAIGLIAFVSLMC
ncbi:hypothetical protein EIP91_004326 [Steccherinum ochraceum]|uniref:Uncharacterized protein n=1 Tax=Steccherinum ochraceum TaxID=92696 RepID=A0A4V2MVY5_9APHY|nr:hypothetical protein EIP91_004326 [Steccherinum ochraceum]